MIVFLTGTLVGSEATSATVEVGGIGYFVNIPLTVSCQLPALGECVKLQIYPVYREDRQELYGFRTAEERDFFKLIVEKVSGIGPRTALNIMSKLSPPVLKDAISTRNADILAKCHGIGKKSAERIIMELSDKDISAIAAKSIAAAGKKSPAQSSNIGDAMAALLSLGYKTADAERAIRQSIEHLGNDASTEAIIRSALNA